MKDILVGDVWFLTGNSLLTSAFAYDKRNPKAVVPEAMPLVRAFRQRTAGNSSATPRRSHFETGGDRKYRSIWFTADFKTPDDSVGMSAAPLQFPGFPDASRGGGVTPDTIPTFAYNWCVCPFSPMGVSGVIWVPGQVNLGYSPADYSPELEISARSLPATDGLKQVPLFYAQPAATLVPGITPPKIANSKAAELDQWPKTLKAIATQLGATAK